jgi:glycosyltransferase involved in cell wall biosynthesis
MPDVHPAGSWEELRRIFRRHRFYIHTADPRLEDGYNMATLEAMAAGLPVLGNRHPTSPVEHGVSGFLSDDPAELRGCALRLLEDRALAAQMGAAARECVARHFSGALFQAGFRRSIETAQRQWLASQNAAAAHRCEAAR